MLVYSLLEGEECREKNVRERREKHMFIRDDILIKALWLDEESHESRLFL